jgi:long-chain acyl-CoA synthetase
MLKNNNIKFIFATDNKQIASMKYTLQDIERLNLYNMFENSAILHPDRLAVGFVGQEMFDYKTIHNNIIKLSFHLYEHGVRKGDKIAIWSQNKPNWVVAFFALMRIGAVAVPILPDFSIVEVNNILKHSESKMIFLSSALYRKINQDTIKLVDNIILLKDFSMRVKADEKLEKGDQFESFSKEHNADLSVFIPDQPKPNDLASIIYTSGTTGGSKGVMLTQKNLVANSIQAYNMYNILKEYRFLSVLPMAHTLEFTIGTLLPLFSGAAIYYLDKPPTAPVLLPALKAVKPTTMLTVPLIIEKIFKSKIRPELTGSPLKAFLYYKVPPMRNLMNKIAGKKLMATFGDKLEFFGIGGAKLDTETEKFLKAAKFPYSIGYGLTETSPLLAGTHPDRTVIGSTGPKAIWVDMKLINIDTKTGQGEIVVKGPNVMQGYYKNPEKTAEVFTEDGYFRTGDTGVIDKKGFLFIKGRIKNMILGSSGENIYPEEIEAQINQSEWVLESLVSQVRGQLVARVHFNYEALEKNWQHFKDSASKSEHNMEVFINDFKDKINQELNRFSKLGKIIEQKEEFVKTPTKKIKRFLYEDKDDINETKNK